MKFYSYSKTAGHYGNGAWVVYSYDCFGMKCVTRICSDEQECIDLGAKPETHQ